jgi:hypothetical protein
MLAHFPAIGRSPDMMDALFKLMDANGDGEISYRVSASSRCW